MLKQQMEGRKKLQMVAKKIRTRKIEPTEEKNQRERSRWEAMGVRLFVNCYWKCSEFSRRLDSSALVTGCAPCLDRRFKQPRFSGLPRSPAYTYITAFTPQNHDRVWH